MLVSTLSDNYITPLSLSLSVSAPLSAWNVNQTWTKLSENGGLQH